MRAAMLALMAVKTAFTVAATIFKWWQGPQDPTS